ncbi:acetyltransferase [Sediminibacterium sp.]|uniref:acetyltransferase n=1 Tax=Sediminibacterium sp. TaxID=1917865 RepID=UPI0025CE4FE6|nr:acetyltransferase [Sediminibacterium sp.]MBW0177686.1 acetyltransferase [Sediminibacterium sp.]
MKKRIIIIGLSNNAKLAAYYFQNDSIYEPVAFVVDPEYKTMESFFNLPVYTFSSIITDFPPNEFSAFVAVGYSKMNQTRALLYNRTKEMGYQLVNYISSKATILTTETMGDNNMILEDNTIQPFVSIGSNNVFWSGNHIGHDVKIGDHNFISSHVVVSGFTEIGNYCFLGVNSTLRDSIIISDKTLIAAGAVVLQNTDPEDVCLSAKGTVMPKMSSKIKI